MVKKFSNLKIYQKIIMAFLSIILVWLVILFYFVIQTNQILQNFNYLESYDKMRNNSITHFISITDDLKLDLQGFLLRYHIQGQITNFSLLSMVEAKESLYDEAIYFLETYENFVVQSDRISYEDTQLRLLLLEEIRLNLENYRYNYFHAIVEFIRMNEIEEAISIFLNTHYVIEYIQNLSDELVSISDEFSNYLQRFNIDFLEFIYNNIFIASFIIVVFILLAGKFLSRAISKPINEIVDVLKSISLGNLDIEIPKYDGDEVGELAKVAATLKEDLIDLINDINLFKCEVVDKGNIDYRIVETAYEGSYKKMVESLNEFKESMVTDMISVINFINNIEIGNFDVEVEEFPGKKILITLCLRSLIGNLKVISSEMENVFCDKYLREDLNIEIYQGEWKKIMVALNDFAKLINKD